MLAQRELERARPPDRRPAAQRRPQEEALATEQALSREALNQVEILNRQINALRVQLASLEQALDARAAEGRGAAGHDHRSRQQAQHGARRQGRGARAASARSSSAGCASCWATGPDVRIVGDRFVFQSEVLFPTASADIEPGGQDELRKLADSLRLISADIPSDLPWVLQINGHTDRRPISTPEFPSNWELSTARAINVGKFLVSEGIPPERIAVAGFAEFQPLDDRARRDRLPAQPPDRDQADHPLSAGRCPPPRSDEVWQPRPPRTSSLNIFRVGARRAAPARRARAPANKQAIAAHRLGLGSWRTRR